MLETAVHVPERSHGLLNDGPRGTGFFVRNDLERASCGSVSAGNDTSCGYQWRGESASVYASGRPEHIAAQVMSL